MGLGLRLCLGFAPAALGLRFWRLRLRGLGLRGREGSGTAGFSGAAASSAGVSGACAACCAAGSLRASRGRRPRGFRPQPPRPAELPLGPHPPYRWRMRRLRRGSRLRYLFQQFALFQHDIPNAQRPLRSRAIRQGSFPSAHSNPAYVPIRWFVISDPDDRPLLWNSPAKIVHYFEFQNRMRLRTTQKPLPETINGAKYLFLVIVRLNFSCDLCSRNKIWYFAIALFVLLMFSGEKPSRNPGGLFLAAKTGLFLESQLV